MSKYINNNSDIEFDNYDDAWEDAMEQLDSCLFSDYFHERVSFHELLVWAMQQPHFYDNFADAVSDAEQDYFDEFYREVEDEDD